MENGNNDEEAEMKGDTNRHTDTNRQTHRQTQGVAEQKIASKGREAIRSVNIKERL